MKEKTAQVTIQNPRYKHAFYHQNEGLLFQFLLYECLQAHQALRKKPNTDSLLQVIGNLEYSTDTWHAPPGHLPRLLHYCSLISLHFEHSISFLRIRLGESLENALLIAKKCFDRVGSGEDEQTQLYAKLRKEITNFLKILFQHIPAFQDNPFVLYFLLRYQEQFDLIYKDTIIQKTFLLLFPQGLYHAQLFLIDLFTKKGFYHLLVPIEQKFQELALC